MIYIIKAIGLPAVMIGRARSPFGYCSRLQVGSPTKLKVIAAYYGDSKTEARLKNRFRGRRLHGSWFCLTEAEANEIYEDRPHKAWQHAIFRSHERDTLTEAEKVESDEKFELSWMSMYDSLSHLDPEEKFRCV